MWKYARDTIENSEFLLHSSLIEMMEANEDIFAAGRTVPSSLLIRSL